MFVPALGHHGLKLVPLARRLSPWGSDGVHTGSRASVLSERRLRPGACLWRGLEGCRECPQFFRVSHSVNIKM